MKTTEITRSSNIGKVEFDEKDTLYVTFLNGNKYSYKGVSEKLYEDMINASSVGRFFSTNVKRIFPFAKVE